MNPTPPSERSPVEGRIRFAHIAGVPGVFRPIDRRMTYDQMWKEFVERIKVQGLSPSVALARATSTLWDHELVGLGEGVADILLDEEITLRGRKGHQRLKNVRKIKGKRIRLYAEIVDDAGRAA